MDYNDDYNNESVIPYDDSNQSISVNNDNEELETYENNPLDSLSKITNSICNAAVKWKELDHDMHKMDLMFQSYKKKFEFDLQCLRERKPIVEKQLLFVNEQFSKILDYAIGLKAESESEINLKIRIMNSVDNYLNNIAQMMAKLI